MLNSPLLDVSLIKSVNVTMVTLQSVMIVHLKVDIGVNLVETIINLNILDS